MKKDIAEYLLIENDVWTSIPEGGFNLDLTFLELDCGCTMLSNLMCFTEVFNHIFG